jgi:hypothetical protein
MHPTTNRFIARTTRAATGLAGLVVALIMLWPAKLWERLKDENAALKDENSASER